MWDIATGQPVTPILKHEDRVLNGTFSPDDREVGTASHNRQEVDDAGGLTALSPDALRTAWENVRQRYPNDFNRARCCRGLGSHSGYDG